MNLCAPAVRESPSQPHLGSTLMNATAEAAPSTAGSLSAFLAGPAINNDPILSELLRQADAFQDCTFIVYDYRNQSTQHVSPSMSELTGYSASESCAGLDFVKRLTNPTDLPYLMLLQSGYVQEAKAPGFDMCAVRFHEYYWSMLHKEGGRVPVVSTEVVLTYSTYNDFDIGVGFHVRNNSECDVRLAECKTLLKKIKQRHNEVYRHASAAQDGTLYLLHHGSLLPDIITTRERQVLAMIAQGHSTDTISRALSIAVNTVESHRKKLLQKFVAKNVAELVKKASKIFWLS